MGRDKADRYCQSIVFRCGGDAGKKARGSVVESAGGADDAMGGPERQ